MKREAGRSEELTSIPLETEMTIFVDNPQIRFKSSLYQHCQRPPYPVSWSRLTTRVQAMILKAFMRW